MVVLTGEDTTQAVGKIGVRRDEPKRFIAFVDDILNQPGGITNLQDRKQLKRASVEHLLRDPGTPTDEPAAPHTVSVFQFHEHECRGFP